MESVFLLCTLLNIRVAGAFKLAYSQSLQKVPYTEWGIALVHETSIKQKGHCNFSPNILTELRQFSQTMLGTHGVMAASQAPFLCPKRVSLQVLIWPILFESTLPSGPFSTNISFFPLHLRSKNDEDTIISRTEGGYFQSILHQSKQCFPAAIVIMKRWRLAAIAQDNGKLVCPTCESKTQL